MVSIVSRDVQLVMARRIWGPGLLWGAQATIDSTVEAPLDLSGAIAGAPPSSAVLVDCLTLWLNNLMFKARDIDTETQRLEAALGKRTAPTVLVSNEVGSGIVPESAEARRFRDLQGRLNQRIAERADRVVLLVAGLPMVVKGQA